MDRLSLPESLDVLRSVRTDRQLVLSTMSAAREWMKLGPPHPLDFIYAPSAMGELPALGLGLALAQPDRQVILLNGDGCLLMNLGVLVTIAAESPPNLVQIVIENGEYEVTGQQQTAAAVAIRKDRTVDFMTIARGSGLSSTFEFQTLAAWRRGISSVLTAAGPTLVVLKTAPIPGGEVPRSPAPAPDRALQYLRALQTT